MPWKAEDFTLFDILVEAEALFGEKHQTFQGYSEGDYWTALYEATKARRAAETQEVKHD